ncbi:hypothetical protein BGX26_004124, partial [Mortierella sp. AD094]
MRPLLLLETDAKQEFEGIEQSELHDALNKAFRLLVESKSTPQLATLTAVHKAKCFADSADGKLSMGVLEDSSKHLNMPQVLRPMMLG